MTPQPTARSKRVRAWALLDPKKIMWVGCDGGNHLEIFPTKRLALNSVKGVEFVPTNVPVEITYKLPQRGK